MFIDYKLETTCFGNFGHCQVTSKITYGHSTIREEVATIDREMLERIYDDFQRRLENCIQESGHYLSVMISNSNGMQLRWFFCNKIFFLLKNKWVMIISKTSGSCRSPCISWWWRTTMWFSSSSECVAWWVDTSIPSLSPGLGDWDGKKENLFLQNIRDHLKKSHNFTIQWLAALYTKVQLQDTQAYLKLLVMTVKVDNTLVLDWIYFFITKHLLPKCCSLQSNLLGTYCNVPSDHTTVSSKILLSPKHHSV